MAFASCTDITSLQTQINALQAASQIADGSETKVTAGTGVTVTGTGTSANPYIVSASSSVVSHDATMTGNGTSGSPLSVVQATDAQRGAVELATNAEAAAGTSTTLAVTPAGLSSAIAASQQVLAVAGGNLAISSGNSIALTPVFGNDATTILFYAFPA